MQLRAKNHKPYFFLGFSSICFSFPMGITGRLSVSTLAQKLFYVPLLLSLTALYFVCGTMDILSETQIPVLLHNSSFISSHPRCLVDVCPAEDEPAAPATETQVEPASESPITQQPEPTPEEAPPTTTEQVTFHKHQSYIWSEPEPVGQVVQVRRSYQRRFSHHCSSPYFFKDTLHIFALWRPL